MNAHAGGSRRSANRCVPPEAPTFDDVLAARERIAPHLVPTALNRYPGLDELAGAEVWVKHENHQPVCNFKVRGGVNLVAQLSDEERRRGVITASTGNHGQSIAFASRIFGVRAIICVPEGANPVKVASIRGLGAEIVEHGRDFDDAREHCEALAAEHGYRYVHSGDEPHLIAGVGTETLEILERPPELDALLVPIGGGSGAAGACIAADALAPDLEVVGVQSEAAPAAYRAWREGQPTQDEMNTAAEGLATRVSFDLPQQILRERLEDFVLVSENDLTAATLHMLERTRNLVETAGAAPLAAVLADPDRFAGKRIALVASGGNVTLDQLRALLR
jgi:threonine dehydratase